MDIILGVNVEDMEKTKTWQPPRAERVDGYFGK